MFRILGVIILVLSYLDGLEASVISNKDGQNKPASLKAFVPNKKYSSGFPGKAGNWPTLDGTPTILAAHRGEKVLQPEHTKAAYEFASIEGADFVEPDLVLTKDGKFVCYHDLTLKSGTDVSSKPQFADRMKSFEGIIDEDGSPISIKDDWFISDFNLTELQSLRVIQKNVGIRPQRFNGMYSIPTFEEYLETVHHEAFLLKRSIGIIPELKHPSYHNKIFESSGGERFMENLLLNTLTQWGYPVISTSVKNCTSPLDNFGQIECGPVIIQSFEASCLKYLAGLTDLERYMLIDVQFRYLTFDGLKEIAAFAQHYSVWKELLYTGILAQIDAEGLEYNKTEIEQLGGFIPARQIVQEAHTLGLKVGIYTIYDSREPSHRGCTVKCDPENKEMELFYYFDMGVDSMFVENVPEAREIRIKYEYFDSIRNLDDDSNAGNRTTDSVHLWSLLAAIIAYFGLRV